MSLTLDAAYFEWLYKHVGSVRNPNPARTHWKLCAKLFKTKFVWFVPNDDNRAADGCELRDEFLHESGMEFEVGWYEEECSMLEMMVALSRRVAFQSYGEPGEWFWTMLKNIELLKYTDDVYEISIEEEVEEVLARINDRTYEANGEGGLFPLRHPHTDQRNVEIAYQMSSYLLENTM